MHPCKWKHFRGLPELCHVSLITCQCFTLHLLGLNLLCTWMCKQVKLSWWNEELFFTDWLQIFWDMMRALRNSFVGETHLAWEFCFVSVNTGLVLWPDEANATIPKEQTDSSLSTVCLLRCFLVSQGLLGQRCPSIFKILSAFGIKLCHRVQDLISCTDMETPLCGHILININEAALRKKKFILIFLISQSHRKGFRVLNKLLPLLFPDSPEVDQQCCLRSFLKDSKDHKIICRVNDYLCKHLDKWFLSYLRNSDFTNKHQSPNHHENQADRAGISEVLLCSV